MNRFRSAGTQVLGVSVDSHYSHANWGADMGGISFPLLADFEPKGGLAQQLGLYLDGPGIGDRATVIIDTEGTVRFAHSDSPSGRRDIAALAAECEKIGGAAIAEPGSIPAGSTLYIKSGCGPSRAARLAIQNLGQAENVTIKNVTDDSSAAAELVSVGGKDQAPCMVIDGQAMYESAEIVGSLVNRVVPLP